MGIINATPDSFSGDGVVETEAAVTQAVQFVADGADILDVGGESTRPGSQPVTAEEEMTRILPVIKAIRQEVNVPISVDTYRADVARAALEAGADWINDIWGLRMDARMAPLVAEKGCPVVIMHNRSKPKDVIQTEKLGGWQINGSKHAADQRTRSVQGDGLPYFAGAVAQIVYRLHAGFAAGRTGGGHGRYHYHRH
jgi:dihydropteroate synthase